MPIELNLTPEQKAALADLFRNYNFVYQNGKLQKWPKADTPIIVESGSGGTADAHG